MPLKGQENKIGSVEGGKWDAQVKKPKRKKAEANVLLASTWTRGEGGEIKRITQQTPVPQGD